MQMLLNLFFLHASISSALSFSNQRADKCNGKCDPSTEECSKYRLKVGTQLHPCSPVDHFTCLPKPRPCTPEEFDTHCSANEHKRCVFEYYHYCIMFNRGVVKQADYRCSIAADGNTRTACSEVSFISSAKLCYVDEVRTPIVPQGPGSHPGASGVTRETLIIRDRPQRCESPNFCPAGMACWADVDSLNDGTSDYYTETCAYVQNPCPTNPLDMARSGLNCPPPSPGYWGPTCRISSGFVRASADLCSNYGSSCVEVSQRIERASCRTNIFS